MKTTHFRKMLITMSHESNGRYLLEGRYHGVNVRTYTDDSEIYDFIGSMNKEDDRFASKCAYNLIVMKFKKDCINMQ